MRTPGPVERDLKIIDGPRAGIGRRLAIFVLMMLGAAVFVYPNAADWFSSRAHVAAIEGYRDDVEALVPHERSARSERADNYNAHIQPGELRDPFAITAEFADSSQAADDYLHLLKTGSSEAIGRVRYDGVGIDLPIYPGTSEDVISKGAGHLHGTSLPIGGPSTHAVLTAHSGMPNARLFTPLHDAVVGDLFWVEVLGERRWYKVENIAVVDGDDLSELRVAEGQDEVTLFTCTPVGVNSHRLLIRGARIDAPTADVYSGPDEATLGFPWWAAGLLVIGATLGFALFPYKRKEMGAQTL